MCVKEAVHTFVHNKVAEKSECFKIWNGKETEAQKGWWVHKVITFFVSEKKSRPINKFHIAYTVLCDTASIIQTK
jgi:hypothetical protein